MPKSQYFKVLYFGIKMLAQTTGQALLITIRQLIFQDRTKVSHIAVCFLYNRRTARKRQPNVAIGQ
ncbi:hypothetical protein E2B99_02615 [Alkanindiges illinoisensis]|uniref:Uncharacterized protein n=1 Tax=Alkanindiges illinoisensis TaxID=197183 RepID=A0A4Y7XEN3_9GAMM|nr:hypothetical protein E2B99_02615 [Alkanindiges illinoisensis]